MILLSKKSIVGPVQHFLGGRQKKISVSKMLPMKKEVFGISVSLLIGFLLFLCIHKPFSPFEMNIEALTAVELGEYKRCWNKITTDPTDHVFYCGSCSEIPGRYVNSMSYCK